ncbi:hypothetical protein I7I48_08944 [Histoplasma ohiense]|nr:hypothetical protein I7I48_08944 [Histoplasma ohiense (nom. inval.)]
MVPPATLLGSVRNTGQPDFLRLRILRCDSCMHACLEGWWVKKEEGTMAMQDDNIVHETIPRAACVHACVCVCV